MNRFIPYGIVHLSLEDLQQGIHQLKQSTNPVYVVCWWKSIPLGDFFLNSDMIGIVDYLVLVKDSVLPTLNSYSGDSFLVKNVEKALLQCNDSELNSHIARILSSFVPVDLPAIADLSIIVCTRNRSEHLLKCLLRLQNQLSKPKEIIVVDNAPNDDSTEKLVRSLKGVIYIKEKRKGLDIARNTGALNATGNIVAYLDDDVVADPLWIFRVMNVFNDESVDAMTGLVLPLSLETESQYIFEKFWSFNKGFARVRYKSDFLIPNGKICPKVWRIGAGANMAFRQDVLEKVKYFDERLDAGAAGCSGDSEIWFRILQAKGTILYDPLAVVYHDHRRDMEGLKNQLFNYMKGNVVAALIQHKSDPTLNYARHVYAGMSKNYLLHLIKGVKDPGIRHKTILREVAGVVSGLFYYLKNKKRNPVT